MNMMNINEVCKKPCELSHVSFQVFINDPHDEHLLRKVWLCLTETKHWYVETWTLTKGPRAMSTETRANFHFCTRYPSKPSCQVQTYVIWPKEGVNRRLCRDSRLIFVFPYETNTLYISYAIGCQRVSSTCWWCTSKNLFTEFPKHVFSRHLGL